jgi:DNA-binding transcriptional regulator YbjK
MSQDEKKSTRRQPKQQRAQQTVEVVLQATVKVLGRDGVDAVTTNRIAEPQA